MTDKEESISDKAYNALLAKTRKRITDYCKIGEKFPARTVHMFQFRYSDLAIMRLFRDVGIKPTHYTCVYIETGFEPHDLVSRIETVFGKDVDIVHLSPDVLQKNVAKYGLPCTNFSWLGSNPRWCCTRKCAADYLSTQGAQLVVLSNHRVAVPSSNSPDGIASRVPPRVFGYRANDRIPFLAPLIDWTISDIMRYLDDNGMLSYLTDGLLSCGKMPTLGNPCAFCPLVSRDAIFTAGLHMKKEFLEAMRKGWYEHYEQLSGYGKDAEDAAKLCFERWLLSGDIDGSVIFKTDCHRISQLPKQYRCINCAFDGSGCSLADTNSAFGVKL